MSFLPLGAKLATACLALLILGVWIACPLGTAAQDTGTPAPQRLDPRFGIVETFANPGAATEAGAGFTRVILRWDVIQPGGPADWKPANVPDPYIERELADGRQVVGLLIGTPAWASADGTADSRAVPKMDAWEAFARRMAAHYKGRIRHWIIWNEPDVWEQDHPGNTWLGSEADYYRLLKTAYRAIKEVEPGSQVAMAGQTYFWDWSHGRRLYLDRLLDVIAADPEAPAHGFFFDIIPYHLYFNPTQAPQVLGEVRASLNRHGIAGKEVWIDETNAPPSDDPQEQPWSAPRFRISLDEQAEFVIQQFAQAFAAGASRVAVKAIAAEGLLSDARGRTQPIRAANGVYILDLPGAACTDPAQCGIGGAPWLLMEAGAPDGRVALIAPPTSTPEPATATVTASATVSPMPSSIPTASLTPTLTPSPSPSPAPIASQQPPSPSPLPAVSATPFPRHVPGAETPMAMIGGDWVLPAAAGVLALLLIAWAALRRSKPS